MSFEKNILVIQTAFPGDAILTLPFIQELKKKNSDYLIDVLCIPSTAEIFAASPHVNNVISLDKKGKQKSFITFLKFIKDLRTNNYEIVYSPHRSVRSALIAMNLSAKESYGFDNSSLKFAFKNTVKYDYSAHEVKRNMELLGDDFSGDKWKIIPEIVIPNESELKVKNYLSDNRINKFITIAAGTIWETKKYPVDYFRQIARHFIDSNYQIVLIGGITDNNLCETIRKDYEKNILIVAGDFSFIDTFELLKSSLLLICNDSAPTHLGVCADIPVLTIYCSTSPQFGFYPYNEKSDYISYDDIYCKPCGIHGFRNCPTGTFNCAKLLSPEMVIQKAEKLLANAG
jgi:heptosyltransferase-2